MLLKKYLIRMYKSQYYIRIFRFVYGANLSIQSTPFQDYGLGPLQQQRYFGHSGKMTLI